ncbi:hypothetical protein NBO_628g0003 [Nosema bombycis CQ1]|uniref:Uncharacterized protein n=1 Tax=Nosema bombycis (strain CQ1 / CVCC 102059) TaxID=578461 RepID=R0M1Q1_NOSB1|nr:hypothetical protein NBO_628g0003 [Nosema bombycis CQ1]|eukprot:EOB11934.1 hypothetical protein NBO_628g0003 [Nosema bombycis CQ1]
MFLICKSKALMVQKRKPKKNLNLIKKNKKETTKSRVEINKSPQKIKDSTFNPSTNDQIDLKSQEIHSSIGTSLDMFEDENEVSSKESLYLEEESCSPRQKKSSLHDSKWNRKNYNIIFSKIKRGTEIGAFIDAHPDFTITNSISAFEEIFIYECGLNPPKFNFEYEFEQYHVETGIDLEIVPAGTIKREVLKDFTELVAFDEKNLLEINKFVKARIIGEQTLSFEFKNKIYRAKRVNKTICLFSEDILITCDLGKFRKWKISVTDATENNLGEFIVLESDRFINVYKNDRLIHRVELNTIIDNIAAYYDRKIIVSTVYKIIFILDLDTKHIEIISGPPNMVCYSLKVYQNIVIVQTRYKLIFIDIANRTKHIAHFQREYKYSCNAEVVQAYDFNDSFRFFNLNNPIENLSVTYKDHIKGFEFYKNQVFLAIGDNILFYKDGQLIDEINAFFKHRHDSYDFGNKIFTKSDFNRWKSIYDQRKQEDLEFIPNDLNIELKKDLDKILGRDKVKNTFNESQTYVSSQKRKKGGF